MSRLTSVARSPAASLAALVLVTGLLVLAWHPPAACSAHQQVHDPVGYGGTRAQDVLDEVGSWPYGQALAVEVDPDREIVYLGSGGAVLVLDTSDPTSPVLLSDSIQSEGLVVDLAYDPAAQWLFLACEIKGLEIWNLRDPTDPVRLYAEAVANHDHELPAYDVEVVGNLVIINTNSIYVFDVTDPAHPQHVGGSSAPGNGTNDIFLDEAGKLHAVGAQAYLRYIVDPSGQLYTDAYYEPLAGGYPLIAGSATPNAAYAGGGDYITVLNPDSPYFPVYSSFYTGANVADIDFQDGLLYFIRAYNRELHIWDVSDVYNPFPISVLSLPSGPSRLEVDGDLVYLADGYGGLVVVDVSDPAAPAQIGLYETFCRNLAVALLDHYAYLAENDDGVLVVDVANPADPVLVGQLDTPGWSYDVCIDDGLLYIADWDGGLRICDLADPVHPAPVGVADVSLARHLVVRGDYAYVVDAVVDGIDSIRALDVSDPSDPVELGSRAMSDFVNAIDLSGGGDFLYAACHDEGLKVLDVSSHGDPVEVDSYPLERAMDVVVRGDCLYAVDSEWDGGLYTFDISGHPGDPVYVSNYHHPLGIPYSNVDVEGLFAFVGIPTYDYIYALFLGDPEYPLELGKHESPGAIFDLLAKDGLLYVADGSAGLRIVRNHLFLSPGGDVAWEVLESGVTSHLRAVHFADAEHGCAVGSYGTVVTTTNGGEDWVERPSGTGEDLFAVFFADASTGWAGGRDGVLLKTSDGGDTWTSQMSGTTGQIRGITFVDSETGWAAGGDVYSDQGFVLKTTDGGEHWQPLPVGVAPVLGAVCFVDALTGWAVGSDGIVLRTADGGASWQSSFLPESSDVNDASFVDEDTGWVCTSNTSVFRTTDGGASWSLQINEEGSYTTFNSISFVDPTTGWVVGGVAMGGHSYGTTNAGVTWKEIQGAHEYYLQSVCFVDDSHGWAVGHDGWILRAKPVSTSVPDEPEAGQSIEAGPRLLPPRPNPFNATARIAYELPEESDVTIRIYDVSGKLVRTLVERRLSAGPHTATWNGRTDSGRELASGVYLAEMTASGAVARAKLTLLK